MPTDDQSLFAESLNTDLDPSKDYSTELVGEGKKYKTVADLAKGAVFKDAHIQRLETEAAEFRATKARLEAELSTRTRLEDLVDNIASSTSKTPISEPHHGSEQVPSSQAQTPEQLEAQIDALLSKREAERRGNTNRATVKQKLQEKLGPNFATKVREQGRQLGLGEAFLNNLAAENPAAFFKLIGVEDKPADRRNLFSSPPVSDVNPDSGFAPSDTFRDKAYYDKLRLEKGDRVYWSPQVQAQLHKDAAADPERFGLTNS
ncbi:hypothetical protein [Bradyrhizobium erythrophlei]|uniref:hypothetical protein n=1 Tax=Bradyrhizobium erythrophlei TaxID=1437360 RepID=UPI0012ABEAE3|nr:hypothetical protein [Bradyrhizobium erythrophlei]